MQEIIIREPSKGFEDHIKIKRLLHKKRMEENVDDDIEELSWKVFVATLEDLAKHKKEKYKFILRGGMALKEAIFHLFKVVWREECLLEG